MDILSEFENFQKNYPRNYARKFLLNYFLALLANHKKQASFSQIYLLVRIVMPKDELVTKRSAQRIASDMFKMHSQALSKVNGIYRFQGGRPKKIL